MKRSVAPYTRIPNALFDALLVSSSRLTKAEFRCLLVIIRFTVGFKRPIASLARSFISEALGSMDVNDIGKALESLVGKNIIQRISVGRGRRSSEYAINPIPYWFTKENVPLPEERVIHIKKWDKKPVTKFTF